MSTSRETQAAILRACARHIAKQLEPLQKRMDGLEQRAAVLERKELTDLITAQQKRIDELEKR